MPFLATANKGVGDNETTGKEKNLCCELTGLPTVYQDRYVIKTSLHPYLKSLNCLGATLKRTIKHT